MDSGLDSEGSSRWRCKFDSPLGTDISKAAKLMSSSKEGIHVEKIRGFGEREKVACREF